MKNKFLKYLLMIIVIAVLAVVAVFGFKFIKNSSIEYSNEFGVIDLSYLISIHPDYQKLATIDEQIAALEQELSSGQDTLKSIGPEMMKIRSYAEKSLMEEVASIKSKLKTERESLVKDMKKEQEDMGAQIRNLKQKEQSLSLSAPKKVTSKTLQQNLDDFSKDLMLLKEKQVAAKRLELQKKLSEEINALKQKNEEELSAYERDILKQNQSRKINLRLKFENVATPEEREAVVSQIKAIEYEEEGLKEIRQRQLAKKLDDVKNKKIQEIEKEVALYNQKLQKDVLAQLSGKNNYEKSSGAELSSGQNSVVMQKLEIKNKEYERKMTEINKKYEKQFEKKRKELEGSLKTQEKELVSKALKKDGDLNAATEKHIAELKSQIESLKQQRDRIYEGIMKDIKLKVEKVAKEEKIKYIIGDFIYNADGVNITEKVVKSE